MEHKLPDLPYSKEALRPHISAETLDYHHGKHHRAYVSKLNELIIGSEFEDLPLEEIILRSSGPVFNNAAQHWNHSFFWKCLSPHSGGYPKGEIADLINKKFGDFHKFKEEFAKAAVANFGSGWTWIVQNNSDIEIMNTSNADNPIKHGQKALLTLDIWEHAYYIDYRNSRSDFIEAFWNLVNWDFVNSNLTRQINLSSRTDQLGGQLEAH
jgi:superoxide dismutase, Fe-Mn family